MNIRVRLNGEDISDGSDHYGAGGAFPDRGTAWAMEEAAAAALCLWASNEATDDDLRRGEVGDPETTCQTAGSWPDVTEWHGTIKHPQTGVVSKWLVSVS